MMWGMHVHGLFRAHLQRRGQRVTPERLRILDAIYDTDGHFDADSLYTRLRAAGSRVSRATVYNTLDLLVECRLVARHGFDASHLTYERTVGTKHHEHLVCTNCGKVVEFCNVLIERVQDEVCARLGFEPTSHTLQIFGRCGDCSPTAASPV